ncbi:MAG: hypothetical protein K2H53_06785 [Clostridia bacterium]|nr:hypothetical protein [Clostridia bacterium]
MSGDQILTDVIGANRVKMYSILTKPIDKRDIFVTKVKRPLEKLIIRRYLRRKRRK